MIRGIEIIGENAKIHWEGKSAMWGRGRARESRNLESETSEGSSVKFE